ncbi:MAG: LysR family transcriptional regulator [Novosphingobium sp.]|uniref:LysR substrate-binding domain-containing protein n=1 Tax=Novosphingobium sp. AAP93 TaxID=1523427 RepID=UPI0006B9F528|nr:LysR substrate-binding domain-containing protein [Novosphingobium sp. AAP93]KPF88538.1 LysR family transcriptional regulator [Novosphingobium sp. AAP93]MBY0394076.1 LysR family transcriptional regulator [Novosphingobium sp.]
MPDLPPLSAVRVFEAAARLENFSRAAEELGMTQAAVSYQVRQLEDRVGRPLFLREKGRVRLSEAGRRLAPAVSAALSDIATAFANLGADDSGILAISTIPSFGGTWLSSRIGRFQIAVPDLAIRLETTGRITDFAREGIDVTIRSGLGPWPGHTAEFLMRYHVTPICSPDFLVANDIKEPADLLRVQRLAQDDPWWAGWFAEAGIALPPAPPAASILFDSQLEEARMAGAGFGAALMTPVFWAEEIATGRLVQPFPTLYFPPFSLWLVRPEGRTGVRKIERFREWLLSEMAAERARGMAPVEVWTPPPVTKR